QISDNFCTPMETRWKKSFFLRQQFAGPGRAGRRSRQLDERKEITMSDCDGMSITIQNEASGADGKPIKVEIQGLNPWKTSTLTGFSVGQFINASGGTAAGNAKSGSGTDGKASGTIQVAAVWDPKTGPEILNLNYQGSPGNDLGWYGCSPQ